MTRVWLHLGCDLRSEVASLTILQPAVVITTLSRRSRAGAGAPANQIRLVVVRYRGGRKISKTTDSFPRSSYVWGFVIP